MTTIEGLVSLSVSHPQWSALALGAKGELEALQAELADIKQHHGRRLADIASLQAENAALEEGMREAAVLIKDMKEALETCRGYAGVGQVLPVEEYRKIFA